MSRRRKAEVAPAAPTEAMTGRCLVCGGPARDTTAAEVPEIMPFNGRKISADELEHGARQRLGMKEGCISFWKSWISVCWTTRIVGAAGDEGTEAALRQLGRRKGAP